MSDQSGVMQTISVPLGDLLLDPNNARLIVDPLWQPVPDDRIASVRVQSQTTRRLLKEVNDLLESMMQFRWLEVEPIRVRPLPENKYVICDGNRRVVALRTFYGAGVARELLLPLVDGVPCLRVVVESSSNAPLNQMVRHTDLQQGWSDFSAAFWRRQWRLPLREARTETSRRWVQREVEELALEMCQLYRQSSWGDQFRPRLFTLFCEALSSPQVRGWLGYAEHSEPNSQNHERFFSWVSLVPLEDASPESLSKSRAIGSHLAVRQLGPLLDDSAALEQLDLGRSIIEVARLGSRSTLNSTLRSLVQYRSATNLSPETLDSAQRALASLRQLILSAGEEPVEPSSELPWPCTSSQTNPGLTSLRVNQYRGLTSLQLADLGRINLLVGVNNAGKTSILEGIYLLCRQADPRGLLDTIRARVRTDPESRPNLLFRLLPGPIFVEGTTNGGEVVSVRCSVTSEPASTTTNLATFLATLRIESQGLSENQVSTTEFYSNRPRRTQLQQGGRAWLAPAVLHSPFSLADRGLLSDCYAKSFEEGTKGEIIEFIKQHVDRGITDIQLVDTDGRFVVLHDNAGQMDLASYGEGMQRIFQIALLFAAHARGILLIDEFENALHTAVLIEFSHLIQKLAARFDVQVFLTTHSKETVDAFVLNDYRTEDIVAFGLYRRAEGLHVVRYSGTELVQALEAIDIDIRRG